MNGRPIVTWGAMARTLLGTGLVLAWAASPGAAQQMDSRWLPWTGCWEATGDTGGPVDDTMLCIRPATDGTGIQMLHVTPDGRVTARDDFTADGTRLETSREGCDGWRTGEFSSDASRVYVQTEQVCEGGVRRSSRGVFSMATPYEWVDVESVDVAGEASAWAMHYRLVSDDRAQAAGFGDLMDTRQMAVRSARIAAAREPDVDDVLDVNEHVGPEAVQAWVVEMDARFDLDARTLEEMADAGIPGNVIDIVVAVSYPAHFQVDREARVTEVEPEVADRYSDRYPYGRFYDPFYWDPFYYGYSPFSYRYGYGFGYGGYGGYYVPTVIRVEPRDSGGGGRVVNGRGWTRGRGSGSSSSGSGRVGPRGGTSTGGAVGSSGGASTSGGSSGRSTGRTAKPRGGGGGG